MSNARCTTTITNLGGPRLLEWFPGGPKHVGAGQAIVVPGLVEDQLAVSGTHNLNLFLSEQSNGRITVQYMISGTGAGITGGGSTNTVARFTTASSVGDSTITDDGTVVGFTGTGGTNWTGQSTPLVSPAGTGTIYFDSGSNTFQISENGGGYVPLMSSTSAFSDITTGVNTTAVMTVGSGAQMLVDAGGVFGRSTLGTDNYVVGNATTGPSLTSGTDNILVGSGTGAALTGGGSNVLIGSGVKTTTTSDFGSVAIGYQAGNTSVSGGGEVLIGYQAGMVTTASSVVFVGFWAGLHNTSGSNNTGIGSVALRYVTTGSGNTAVGGGALGASTFNGDDNVAVGSGVGFSITTAARNVILGNNTFSFPDTGSDNVVIGNQANMSGNSAASNGVVIGSGSQVPDGGTVVGSAAGQSGATAPRLTAIGRLTAAAITSGSDNVFVGDQSGKAATIGSRLVCVGSSAGVAVTTGSDNIYIGDHVSPLATTGNSNTVIGAQAGSAMTTDGGHTLIGSSAGQALVGTSQNTAVGTNAMSQVTTGGGNVAVGFDAGGAVGASTGSNNTAVGSQALMNVTTGADIVAVGSSAGLANTTGFQNTLIGSFAGATITTGANNIVVGYGSAVTGLTTGSQNVIVGNLTAFTTGSDNVSVGYLAGNAATTAAQNVFVGSQAGKSVTTSASITAVGYGAMSGVTTGQGTAVGYLALSSTVVTTANTAVGTSAGVSITTGDNNCIFGDNAGQSLTTGGQSVVIGSNAFTTATVDDQVVMIGYQAGMNQAAGTGSGNTFVGYQAGFTNSTGANNTLLGRHAGFLETTANNNTFIGASTGANVTTGSNNTILGAQAGGTLTTGLQNILLGDHVDVDTGATSNVFIAGSATSPINDIYFGKGSSNTVPTAYTIHGTASSTNGTDGANILIAGGIANQAADSGGDVLIQTASTGAGTTLATRIFVKGTSGNVGIGATPGAFALDVSGDTRITGKLTVGGGIDPTFLELAGLASNTYLNMTDGSSTGLAPANQGRIRYNSGTQQFEMSTNGTSYITIAAGGGVAFSSITNGTNTSAAMTVGSGATLDYSGSGTINASSLQTNFTIAGPTAPRVYTFPNASTTVLTTNAAVTVAQGGTGDASFTAYAVLCGGTTSTGALQNVSGVGTSGQVLTSNGASALPTWQTPSSSLAFSAITTGTNTTATMTVGTGASIKVSGTGAIGVSSVGTGTDNIVLGKGIGSAFTTTDQNVQVGSGAGPSLDGNQNVFIGYHAAFNATSPSGNVVIGASSGAALTSGGSNVIISGNLGSNTSNAIVIGGTAPQDGVVVGLSAGSAGITASHFTAIGRSAGGGTTNGADNSFLGYHAGISVTTGANNTCIGSGADVLDQSGSITVVGSNTKAAFACTIVGASSGNATASGSSNAVFGGSSATVITTAAGLAIFGYSAGNTNTTGSNNTIIGNGTDVNAGSDAGVVVIGHTSIGANGSVVIGDTKQSSVTNDLYIETGDVGIKRSAAAILGITTGNGTFGGAMHFGGRATGTFAVSPASTGRVFYDSTLQHFYVSENGGAYALLLSGTNSVANGGTGDTSFTAYSVICGGTTSTGALQNVSGVGTSGQVLTSNGASTLPTWQTPSSSASFSSLTTGTNTTATMTVGSGATLGQSGSGIIGLTSQGTAARTYVMAASVSSITSAADCVLIGDNAGNGLTSGNQNTFVGSSAGKAVTTSADVTAIGYKAGTANTAAQGVFIGSQAGQANVAGTGNTYIGYQAANAAAGSNDKNNTVIGFQAALNINGSAGTAGSVYIGASCAATPTNTAGGNVVIGYNANMTNSANTVAIGSAVQGGGSRNVIIGQASGKSAQTYQDCVVVGAQSAQALTVSDGVFIGSGAGQAVSSGASNTLVGRATCANLSTGAQNTVVGREAGANLISSSQSVIIGYLANPTQDATSVIVGALSTPPGNCVAVGWSIAAVGTRSGVENVYIGNNADSATNTANHFVCIGQTAICPTGGTVVGYTAGNANATSARLTAVGAQTAKALTNSSDDCSFFGDQAGKAVTSGANNTLLGSSAGVAVTSGGSNTFIGKSAGATNTTGASNVIIGNGCDTNAATTSSNSIIIGGTSGVKGKDSALIIDASSTAVNSSTSNDLYIGSGDTGMYRVAAGVLGPCTGNGGTTAGDLHIGKSMLTSGTMTATNSALVREGWNRFDWTVGMFVALSGTADDITVCTLPAKTIVVDAYVVITAPGAGTTTLTVSVGRVSSSYIDYIVASDAQAAANTIYGNTSGTRGTNLTGYDFVSYTATTLVKAHFISTGANLSSVTGSTGAVYLKCAIVP